MLSIEDPAVDSAIACIFPVCILVEEHWKLRNNSSASYGDRVIFGFSSTRSNE